MHDPRKLDGRNGRVADHDGARLLPLRGHFGRATPRTGIDAIPPTWQWQR